MKSQMQIPLILVLIGALLPACGPSQADMDTTATQAAIDDNASQTAAVPAATSTLPPSPTATLTPTPTTTPTPAPTPTPQPTPSGSWADINGSYQYLYLLDFSAGEIITTTVLLEQGTIDRNQANNRIQIIHHILLSIKSAIHNGESPYNPGLTYPYKPEIYQATIELSQACRRWWRGESDAQMLGKEATTTRENIQPPLNALHEWLWAQEVVDVSFTATVKSQFADFGATSEQVMDYDASSDIFQMQRGHRSTWWGLASTLGTYVDEKGYTSPDNSFTCNLAYSGIDGDLLYDFIFPDHSSVVFTDDFGKGQAVERYPLDPLPVSDEAAKAMLNGLYEGTILPSLKQQHPDLRLVDQKWIEVPGDTSLEALQVIVELPEASFINQDAGTGPVQVDVLRGLLIFVQGDAVYIISNQEEISSWEELTEAERISRVKAGLVEIQQSCTYQAALAPTISTSTTLSTSTQTPTPTLVSTPLPTATKNPLAGSFRDGKLILTAETFNQLLDKGEDYNMFGYYLFEAFLYDAMLEYSLMTDQLQQVYDLQHSDYEELGKYELAIENLKQVIDLSNDDAGSFNDICWNLGLLNRPEEALPYCEQAVEIDPAGYILDSRGLVYAMLGKYPEAASDFEAALNAETFYGDEITQRQEWVSALNAGTNPITDEVLAQLRAGELSMEIDPWYRGNMPMSYLVDQYEQQGYTFSETTINSQPGFVGSFQDGDCRVELKLLGNRREFFGGSSTIVGCSDEDMDRHIFYFVADICRDSRELAKVIVWESADWLGVIGGKPVTELSPTFGGFQFSVERLTQDGETGIVVTANPVE